MIEAVWAIRLKEVAGRTERANVWEIRGVFVKAGLVLERIRRLRFRHLSRQAEHFTEGLLLITVRDIIKIASIKNI